MPVAFWSKDNDILVSCWAKLKGGHKVGNKLILRKTKILSGKRKTHPPYHQQQFHHEQLSVLIERNDVDKRWAFVTSTECVLREHLSVRGKNLCD